VATKTVRAPGGAFDLTATTAIDLTCDGGIYA
jgi:hypothetical protein